MPFTSMILPRTLSAGHAWLSKRVGQAGEDAHQVLDASHLRAKDDLALLIEGTDGHALGVEVETNVKHETPPKAEERDNQRPWLHVTLPTEASFIVSRRSNVLSTARPGPSFRAGAAALSGFAKLRPQLTARPIGTRARPAALAPARRRAWGYNSAMRI